MVGAMPAWMVHRLESVGGEGEGWETWQEVVGRDWFTGFGWQCATPDGRKVFVNHSEQKLPRSPVTIDTSLNHFKVNTSTSVQPADRTLMTTDTQRGWSNKCPHTKICGIDWNEISKGRQLIFIEGWHQFLRLSCFSNILCFCHWKTLDGLYAHWTKPTGRIWAMRTWKADKHYNLTLPVLVFKI